MSQDVDLAIPVDRVESVKTRLRDVEGLVPSANEPSVYVPTSASLIEADFLGLDPAISDASETYVLEDAELPLMVFGPLGLVRPGRVVRLHDLHLPLPRVGDLIAEKLLTDRTGEKGARDLLVVAGLLMMATPEELDGFVERARGLSESSRQAIRSSLTMLSLLDAHRGMPDPAPVREQVHHLLRRLGDGD